MVLPSDVGEKKRGGEKEKESFSLVGRNVVSYLSPVACGEGGE